MKPSRTSMFEQTKRLKPPANGLETVCMRIWVAHAGFEPAISALRGRCPGPLDECASLRPLSYLALRDLSIAFARPVSLVFAAREEQKGDQCARQQREEQCSRKSFDLSYPRRADKAVAVV